MSKITITSSNVKKHNFFSPFNNRLEDYQINSYNKTFSNFSFASDKSKMSNPGSRVSLKK